LQPSSVQTESKGTDKLPELRVATYNVWFESFHLKERCQLLIQSLKAVNPHLIGLQEGLLVNAHTSDLHDELTLTVVYIP